MQIKTIQLFSSVAYDVVDENDKIVLQTSSFEEAVEFVKHPIKNITVKFNGELMEENKDYILNDKTITWNEKLKEQEYCLEAPNCPYNDIDDFFTSVDEFKMVALGFAKQNSSEEVKAKPGRSQYYKVNLIKKKFEKIKRHKRFNPQYFYNYSLYNNDRTITTFFYNGFDLSETTVTFKNTQEICKIKYWEKLLTQKPKSDGLRDMRNLIMKKFEKIKNHKRFNQEFKNLQIKMIFSRYDSSDINIVLDKLSPLKFKNLQDICKIKYWKKLLISKVKLNELSERS